MNYEFTLLDNRGKPFAGSVHLDALMALMRTRWAGSVVTDTGAVLFDIAADRQPACSATVTAKMARAELAIAWERYTAAKAVAA